MSDGFFYHHAVYALSGPDMVVRYVGRTRGELQNRLTNHLQASKQGKRPLHAWIREQGNDLVMREIERFQDIDPSYCRAANAAERAWVRHYAEAGNDLFNVHYLPKPGPCPKIIYLEDQVHLEKQA